MPRILRLIVTKSNLKMCHLTVYSFFLSLALDAARPEYERTVNQINRNMNNIRIIFEDTVNSENNSNYLNSSVDSRPRTPTNPDDNDSGNGASNCESPTPENVVVKPKPKPKPLQSHAINRPNVPNAVFVGQLYEQRRKLRMQQIERKEREQRKFHAKNVPNFNSIHAAQSAKQATEEPKITIPVTPKVVHHHLKNLERVRAKVSKMSFYFVHSIIIYS